MPDRAYDRERLRDLFHYVIWVAGARPGFGATKLYKVAWFADARHFTLYGQSITGAPYIREKHGPIPRDGISVRNEMETAGIISQWKDRIYDHEGWRFKALVPPAANLFSSSEKATVDYWIKHIDEDHTATSVSDLSHNYGWTIARMGEKIPLTSILADRIRDPEGEELEWAKKKASELRLL